MRKDVMALKMFYQQHRCRLTLRASLQEHCISANHHFKRAHVNAASGRARACVKRLLSACMIRPAGMPIP